MTGQDYIRAEIDCGAFERRMTFLTALGKKAKAEFKRSDRDNDPLTKELGDKKIPLIEAT